MQSLRNAYVQTNTDLGNPGWLAVQSHSSSDERRHEWWYDQEDYNPARTTNAVGASRRFMSASFVDAIAALVGMLS
jgi:hypothetical protein